MSATRDEGLAALQRNDSASAVGPLELACQQDPNDYLAHMYLGAAYGQLNRNDEALQVLTRAVQIQPANAQARFNLGIALQRGGWQQEALTAFEQALTLQPEYPQATQAIQYLRNASAAQHAPAPAQAAGTTGLTAAQAPAPSAAEAEPGGLANYAQAPAYAPAHPAQGAGGQTSSLSQSLHGTQSLHGSGAPAGAARGYGARPQQAPVIEDSFNLGQAFKDWGSAIASPARFFNDQAGREGIKAPLATLLAFQLVILLSSVISKVIHGESGAIPYTLGMGSVGYPGAILATLLCAMVIHFIGRMFGNSAGYAGSVRAIVYASAPFYALIAIALLFISMPQPSNMGSPFPNMQAGSPTSATSGNPFALPTSPTGAPTAPGQAAPHGAFPGGGSPGDGAAGPGGSPFGSPAVPGQFGGANNAQMMGMFQQFGILLGVEAVGGIWTLVLLVIGLASIMRISGGAAFGTVLVSFILLLVVIFVISFVLGLVLAAVMAGAVAHSAAGGGAGGFH